MPKYQKRPDRPFVAISGIGVVKDDRVFEGDFDAYVPGLLVRVPDAAPVVAPAVEAPIETPTPAEISAEVPAESPAEVAVSDAEESSEPVKESPANETRKLPRAKRR